MNVSATDSAVLGFDPDALREKYRIERDKRIRPEGNDQYVEVSGIFPAMSMTPMWPGL